MREFKSIEADGGRAKEDGDCNLDGDGDDLGVGTLIFGVDMIEMNGVFESFLDS